jgi:hypothetical protein
MTLAKRLGEVEDNLSPREAMTCWMREAHEFGCYESYARWLVDQPDDVYPLVRMPRQVVGAVRARRKGVPDLKLKDEFRRVQKDLLFLYYLHKQPNKRALVDHEAIQLRVIILIKEIRALTLEKHGLDQMRLGRVNLGGGRHPKAGKVERSAKALYQEHVRDWLPEAEEVRARILRFLAAVQMTSRRYFGGVDILYPDTRDNLTGNLETIANLMDTFADPFLGVSPQSDDDFRDYVLALLGDEDKLKGTEISARVEEAGLEVAREARLLAEQWILMARSEALEELGEHQAAQALAEKLIRQAL